MQDRFEGRNNGWQKQLKVGAIEGTETMDGRNIECRGN